MGLLTPPPELVNQTLIGKFEFDQDAVSAYFTRALAKLGYSNVKIEYKNQRGYGNDPDTFTADVSGTKGGEPVTGTLSQDEMSDALIAELKADGHQPHQSRGSKGARVCYSDINHKAYATAQLEIPAKVS